MSIGSWINSSGGSSNVLNGDVAEIIVYDRALTAEEIADVEEYLRSRLPETVPAGPVEPVRLYALLDGGANAAHGWLPDGDPNASGSAVMTIRPGENAMDFNIVMETAFDVSQAHFYAIPGGAEAANLGDSDICWGNRWSNHDLLVGENYVIDLLKYDKKPSVMVLNYVHNALPAHHERGRGRRRRVPREQVRDPATPVPLQGGHVPQRCRASVLKRLQPPSSTKHWRCAAAGSTRDSSAETVSAD
jgi:hypothetical protein